MNTQAVISKTCLIPCNSYRNRSVLSSYNAVGTCLRLRGQNNYVAYHTYISNIYNLVHTFFCDFRYPLSYESIQALLLCTEFYVVIFVVGKISGGGGAAFLPPVHMTMSYILIQRLSLFNFAFLINKI